MTTDSPIAPPGPDPARPALHIRRAGPRDVPELHRLLREVLEVHHRGRPDLFRTGAAKYDDGELLGILADDATPVYAAFADDDATMLGYAFCAFQRHADSHILVDATDLYVDDLCVDEPARGRHVGSALYRHVVAVARGAGCRRVTLNVWSCNPEAMAFYRNMGLTPYRVGMERVL